MKICICTHLWLELHHGGVDRIVKFARNVSRNGVDVCLVDRSTKKSLRAMLLDTDKYRVVENGESQEKSYPFRLRFLFPGIIKFLQHSLNLVISIISRTTISEVNYSFLVDPYLFAKLLFVCRKEKVDLIQCEFPFTVFSSLLVKKIIGVPIVYDAHNIESARIGSFKNVSELHVGIVRRLELASSKICDAVFVVSGSDRKQLVSWGVPTNKISVVPNSVEIDEFSPEVDGSIVRERYGLGGAFVIVFHGFLGYPPNREAAQILLDLLPVIVKKYDWVRLLLVGNSPPKTSDPNVIATGFVETVSQYIAAADLAAVPLLSGGGTKLKILEYMACGKAVVTTTKGAEGLGLRNRYEVLITECPNSDFIDLVFEAIDDVGLRQQLGINARKKIESFYDWNKNAKRAAHIYQSLFDAYEKTRSMQE
jgi:glycosyltransferase involved in cell wall biosynthesis